MCSACYQYQRRTGAERDVVALNAAHARSLDAAWARLERDLALSRG